MKHGRYWITKERNSLLFYSKGNITWNAIQNQNFILIVFFAMWYFIYCTYEITSKSNKIFCCLTMSYITNKTLPNYVSHEILLMIIEETCHKTFVLTFTTIRFVIKQLLCRLEVSTTVVHSEQEQFSWKGKLILPVIVAMASGR